MMASSKADTKVLGRIIEQLQKLDQYETDAGFWSGIHEPSGLPNATLAIMNNEGTEDIPPRPFMDEAGNASQLSVADKAKKAVADVVMCRKTAYQALQPIAQDSKEWIVAFMYDWGTLGSMYPNNSTKTIKIKGKDRPLIDTYELSESVQTRVKKKEGSE